LDNNNNNNSYKNESKGETQNSRRQKQIRAEENVFKKNYSTEDINDIYDAYVNNLENRRSTKLLLKTYSNSKNKLKTNDCLINEKSSISFTPISHRKSNHNNISSLNNNNKFNNSSLLDSIRENRSDNNFKSNEEFKDILNISNISGLRKNCFNRNLYSGTTNSYVNIKNDLNFSRRNMDNLINKLNSNKNNLANLIDNLSYSKKEFIKDNTSNNNFNSTKIFVFLMNPNILISLIDQKSHN